MVWYFDLSVDLSKWEKQAMLMKYRTDFFTEAEKSPCFHLPRHALMLQYELFFPQEQHTCPKFCLLTEDLKHGSQRKMASSGNKQKIIFKIWAYFRYYKPLKSRYILGIIINLKLTFPPSNHLNMYICFLIL